MTVKTLVEYTVDVVMGGGVTGAIDEFETPVVGITEEFPEMGTVVFTNGPLELGATEDVPTDGGRVLGALLEVGTVELPLEIGEDGLEGTGDVEDGVSIWV